MNKILLILLLCLHVCVGAQTLDKDGIPDVALPHALVNDFAEILSADNQQILEKKLLAYNDSTTNQIYVITVKSIGDYSIEDYTLRTARKWKIGQQDKNNGILLLVSKDDRKVDIEVGYGLESVVTDFECKQIIQDLIVPAFKQTNYASGINDATDRLIGLIQEMYKSEVKSVIEDDILGYEKEDFPIGIIVVIITLGLILFFWKFPRKFGANYGNGTSWTYSSSGESSFSSSRSSSSSSSGSSFSGGGGGSFSGGGGGSFGGGGSSGSW